MSGLDSISVQRKSGISPSELPLGIRVVAAELERENLWTKTLVDTVCRRYRRSETAGKTICPSRSIWSKIFDAGSNAITEGVVD